MMKPFTLSDTQVLHALTAPSPKYLARGVREGMFGDARNSGCEESAQRSNKRRRLPSHRPSHQPSRSRRPPMQTRLALDGPNHI